MYLLETRVSPPFPLMFNLSLAQYPSFQKKDLYGALNFFGICLFLVTWSCIFTFSLFTSSLIFYFVMPVFFFRPRFPIS
uniref:Putative ovule protein n=1 Tax=Solanum chacoense TaxID=4108 RepID=A0A0V0I281_SOLCH